MTIAHSTEGIATAKKSLRKALVSQTLVDVVVRGHNKQGLTVVVEGIVGYIPKSQIDISEVSDMASYLDRTLTCRVVRADKRDDRVLLSRRMVLESVENPHSDNLLNNRYRQFIGSEKNLKNALQFGQTIYAKVKSCSQSGLYINLGGVEGFVPNSELELDRVPRDLSIYVDKMLPFKVTKLNRPGKKVALSRKAVLASTVLANMQKGELLEGVIQNITPLGIFVDLGGLTGLVRPCDNIKNTRTPLVVGQSITTRVLDIDVAKTKISLGIKQAKNVNQEAMQHYCVGQTVEGYVTQIVDYGLFVELEHGIEGLVHISTMDSTSSYHKGDIIQVKIGDIDLELRRIGLTL